MFEVLNVYMFNLMLNYYKTVRGLEGCYIITYLIATLSAGMKG